MKKVYFLTVLLTIAFGCFSQTLYMSVHGIYDGSRLVDSVERQTKLYVVCPPEGMKALQPTRLDFDHALPEAVWAKFLAGTNLKANVDWKKRKVFILKKGNSPYLYKTLTGDVETIIGERLAGATVAYGIPVKTVTADSNGVFRIEANRRSQVLHISFTGYVDKDTLLTNDTFNVIRLQPKDKPMRAATVGGHRRRHPTPVGGDRYEPGNTPESTPGRNVEKDCSANVLDGVEGKMPGLFIRPNTGVPGSADLVLIRGQNSIQEEKGPLVLVDGIPKAGAAAYQSQVGTGSAMGITGAEILDGVDPSDIESIRVLKDAEATALYGSRGANGVILIRLRHSPSDTSLLHADVGSGWSRALSYGKLMNTRQYFQVRNAALSLDNTPVSALTLPEGYYWDSTSYTDYRKKLLDHPASLQRYHLDLSGVSHRIHYLFSGNYAQSSTIFPPPTGDQHRSILGDFSWQAPTKSWQWDYSIKYTQEAHELPGDDPTYAMVIDPNAPFHDTSWMPGGLTRVNIPLALTYRYYGKVKGWLHHLQASYQFPRIPGLTLLGNFGYDRVIAVEKTVEPTESQDPSFGTPAANSSYNNNFYHSAIGELTVQYRRVKPSSVLDLLAGATWQEEGYRYTLYQRNGYVSDAMLFSGGKAPDSSYEADDMLYRYGAVFSKASYTLLGRYEAEVSARYEGSSRGGPHTEPSLFGSAGLGWTFSKEAFIRNAIPWMSQGRIRGNFAITGNDLLSDNAFAGTYQAINNVGAYQGRTGLHPVQLVNQGIRYEVNYRSELGMALGFFKDQVQLSATAYLNWTSNQLIYENLPSAAGIPAILINQPANVENKGIELWAQVQHRFSKDFQWNASFSLTCQQNILKKFPSLGNTPFANTLQVGQSLNVFRGLHYQGIDPLSGVYQFKDRNGDGKYTSLDWSAEGDLNVKAYGGWENNFRYGGWELGIFLLGVKQHAISAIAQYYAQSAPGMYQVSGLGNAPTDFLHYWSHPGDREPLQRPTANPGGPAGQALSNYVISGAAVTDGSFWRLKNVSLSYHLPSRWGMKRITEKVVYIKMENLLTLTNYRNADPETMKVFSAPLTRSFIAGIKLTIK